MNFFDKIDAYFGEAVTGAVVLLALVAAPLMLPFWILGTTYRAIQRHLHREEFIRLGLMDRPSTRGKGGGK